MSKNKTCSTVVEGIVKNLSGVDNQLGEGSHTKNFILKAVSLNITKHNSNIFLFFILKFWQSILISIRPKKDG